MIATMLGSSAESTKRPLHRHFPLGCQTQHQSSTMTYIEKQLATAPSRQRSWNPPKGFRNHSNDRYSRLRHPPNRYIVDSITQSLNYSTNRIPDRTGTLKHREISVLADCIDLFRPESEEVNASQLPVTTVYSVYSGLTRLPRSLKSLVYGSQKPTWYQTLVRL
jgi:hypothetical protein